MKYFDWDPQKNALLIKTRQISFEAIVIAIQAGDLFDILEHPNRQRYPNQRVMVVWMEDYGYLVPFVEDNEKFFLKTIIPSRKATQVYRKERS